MQNLFKKAQIYDTVQSFVSSQLASQQIVISKCKHTKESLALVGLQLWQLVGFRPQFVSSVQLKHCAQIDGVVPALPVPVAVLLSGALARRPHRAHQGGFAAYGVWVAPDPVAQRCEVFSRPLLVAIAAGDPERRLAVDEVEAGLRDDDLVVHQSEAALSERLALTVLPLQLVFQTLVVVVATWKQSEKKQLSDAWNTDSSAQGFKRRSEWLTGVLFGK